MPRTWLRLHARTARAPRPARPPRRARPAFRRRQNPLRLRGRSAYPRPHRHIRRFRGPRYPGARFFYFRKAGCFSPSIKQPCRPGRRAAPRPQLQIRVAVGSELHSYFCTPPRGFLWPLPLGALAAGFAARLGGGLRVGLIAFPRLLFSKAEVDTAVWSGFRTASNARVEDWLLTLTGAAALEDLASLVPGTARENSQSISRPSATSAPPFAATRSIGLEITSLMI